MGEQKWVASVAVAAAIYSIDRPYDYEVPGNLATVPCRGQRVMVPFGTGNRKTDGIILSISPKTQPRKLKVISYVFEDQIVLSEMEMALALWMCKRYFCTFFQAANALLPPGVWSRTSEVFEKGDFTLSDALQLAGKSKKKADILQLIYESEKPMTAAEIEKSLLLDSVQPALKQLAQQQLVRPSQTFQQKVREKCIRLVRLTMPLEQALSQIGQGKLREKREVVLQCVSQAGQLPEKEVCYLTGAGQALIRRLISLGILEYQTVEVSRRPTIPEEETAPPLVLTSEQEAAYQAMTALIAEKQPEVALLYGITGSGKTKVYLRLIQRLLQQEKGAILLVPEIALTPQMVRQFCLYFRDEIAVIHSGLTYAQRYDEYRRVKNGKARVVVGTRTAVFAPVHQLGCIIVDEEQEPTYKSDSDPRYDAREVAKYRAVKENCLLVFGSATPSVESFFAAKNGKYHLLTLQSRYQNVPLPETILADMRGQLKNGDPSHISSQLRDYLQTALERGEQSILFINRRGSARMAACVDCGYIPMCKNCSVALTYHSKNRRMMCHHCGYSEEMIETCPNCGGSHLRLIGSGTQSIEEELREMLPNARLIRMDADTTEGRTSHEKLLDTFGKGKADILLGTQMVAKGLDFPNVTLVGVLEADLSLYSGDYHAQERTFSLLTQVIGRAGRREKPGRAVIQTYTPENPVILAAAQQDYDRFFDFEIQSRQALNAPPFVDLFVFTFSGGNETEVWQAASAFALVLKKKLENAEGVIPNVLGPAPAYIARLNRRYRYQVSFRGKNTSRSRELVSQMLIAYEQSPYGRNLALSADINPNY